MARKVSTVNIPEDSESRDAGKRYIITELPSTKGEKWGMRAMNALLASGIEISDAAAAGGLRGLAMLGATGLAGFHGLPWDQAEPLIDEMMTCVTIDPDPVNRPGTHIRPLKEVDIEDIKTRLLLRNEWLELHFGFSFAAKASISGSAADAEDPSTT